MRGAAATIAPGYTVHRGLELTDSKATARGPCIGYGRNGNGNVC